MPYKENIDGEKCLICGKTSYTSSKKASTAMHTIKRHTETAKTKISKRFYYSKECSINGIAIFHLTSTLKK